MKLLHIMWFLTTAELKVSALMQQIKLLNNFD